MTHTIALSRPLDRVRDAAARIQRRAAELWRKDPRASVGLGLGAALASAIVGIGLFSPSAQQPQPTAVPAPPPLILRQIAPDQAVKVNAVIPLTAGPNPAAAPFAAGGNTAARAQALNCLASAIYYEAGNQDEDGARAVAQVVLNRVRHPAFPASVCGVVYQGSTRATGCQFTFTCDGSLSRRPDPDGWQRALRIAQSALTGSVYAPVGWATHYHADYVVPYWASTMAKNAVVGAHLFYRWQGGWGRPAMFAQAYSGSEPNAEALRVAALSIVHVAPVMPGTLAAAIKNIPGAEPLKLSPSLRGDKRVAVRFNLTARTASEQAMHQDYSKKFAVSDNLKWSLSNTNAGSDQAPLGRAVTAPAAASGASTSH